MFILIISIWPFFNFILNHNNNYGCHDAKENVTDIDLLLYYALFAIHEASVVNQFNKKCSNENNKQIFFLLICKKEN